MYQLIFFAALFVGSHLLLSHPLRAPLVAKLGNNGFMAVYALVALFCLSLLSSGFRHASLGAPLWPVGESIWGISTLIMLLASILLLGSFVRNPALPAPNAAALATRPLTGVFTITRHPMNWSFALWALAHALVSPRPPVLVLCVAIATLAIIGSIGQDAKKSALIGQPWRDYMARSSFIPFAKGAQFPGMHALGGGVTIWLIITWLHPYAGAGMRVGIWHWFGG